MHNCTGKPIAISCLLICLVIGSTSAYAQNRRIVVRDAETESIIRAYASPIFEAAGLNPESVGIRLILHPSLNAFVTRGQNIFIHTGLLLQAKNVNEVIGVIAHETGHISGGHLARLSNAVKDAGTIGLVTGILGAGAGILTGRGDLTGAAIAGGQTAAQRSFSQFSRTQESSADQAALSLLEATGTSARGLYSFLKILEDQDLLSTARQDPYLRTHPLTRERLDAIESHLTRSRYSDTPANDDFQHSHDRLRAKLFAYTYPFITVMRTYPNSDQSVAARYARAFAHYQKPDTAGALSSIDALISDFPNDPYFNELKAEILFDSGNPAAAIKYYAIAAERAERSALIYLALGQSLIATGDPANLDAAIVNLRKCLSLERNTAFAWHQLAIAYGRQDRFGLSSLALAEEAMLQGRYKDAIYQAGKAETLLKPGTKEVLQAGDIINAANNILSN